MRRNGESITRYLDKRDRSKSRVKPDRIAYSPKELAQAAGISLSLLYKMWREGKGPPDPQTPRDPMHGGGRVAAVVGGGVMRQLSDCLAPLMVKHQWIIWRWRDDQKIPYQAMSPRSLASVTNPSHWTTYAKAVAAAPRDSQGGIGFVLLNSGIGAIDLDDCYDGTIAKWAREIVGLTNSYVEVTPSGEGLRIIGTATGGRVLRKIGSMEVWRNAEKFMTVTGIELGRCLRLRNIDDVIDQLVPADRVHNDDNQLDIHPERHNALAVLKKYRYREVDITWDVAIGWRSDVIWKIGCGLRNKGANPSEVAAVLLASKAWLSKHGHNRRELIKEVQRVFAK
jgi:hypothetical protein